MQRLRQSDPLRRDRDPAEPRLSSLHGRWRADHRGRRGAGRGRRRRVLPLVRERPVGRTAPRKPKRGLTSEASRPGELAVPAELLRPALELAWVVARLGEEASPPIAVPGAVRRLLRFSRLPDRALATVR